MKIIAEIIGDGLLVASGMIFGIVLVSVVLFFSPGILFGWGVGQIESPEKFNFTEVQHFCGDDDYCKFRAVGRYMNNNFVKESQTLELVKGVNTTKGDCDDYTFTALSILKELDVEGIMLVKQPHHACYGLRNDERIILSDFCITNRSIDWVSSIN